MKRIAAIALFVAATLLTASRAVAQDHRVIATVPFNFTVSDSWLPAGTYTIGFNSTAPNILSILDRAKSINISALGMTYPRDSEEIAKLVFRKYGNQYFLSEIRFGSALRNIQFPATKLEMKARTQSQVAGLRVNDYVLVALNR
jgi:hypothetical protein